MKESAPTVDEPVPPLVFVDRDGELARFDTITQAETNIEAIDVEADEYRAFDATGRRLTLSSGGLEKKSGWDWLKHLRDAGWVSVDGAGDAAPDELRAALIDFRVRYGEVRVDLDSLALSDLIDGIQPS